MNNVHDLASFDLNLLIAFDALLAERSVTRAAARVGVTQSAMSHTLRRLRQQLDDPLLVRGRGGMVPTPRAEALVVPIRSGLVTIEHALNAPEGFDPASSSREFRLASPDIVDVLILPGLLASLRAQAPSVALTVQPLTPSLPHDLETGALDLAVLARPQLQAAGALVGRTLLRDGLSCFLRADHPSLRDDGTLTLEAYISVAHALISPTGRGPGPIDALLAERGLSRRIALRLPHFYAALSIIGQTDLVLTAPTQLAELLPCGSPLTAVAPPLPTPQHAVAMTWHPRFTDDPAHRWFREQVSSQFPSASGTTGAGGERSHRR